MSEKKPSRPSWVRRLFRPWYVKLFLLLVVAAAVAYAVAPQQVTEIISVTGRNFGVEGVAPPRYKIVWQPAEPVPGIAPDLTDRDSLIRPQLAEEGTALYFTRRKADGTADIYLARLLDGQWQPAEPVDALNTEADDVGPVIRADGKRLYLYSNREGGHGGFDLYGCDKTDDGWSTPQNLGPRVNSLAHEYDPAVSQDGSQLFFASNRTPQMMRRLAESNEEELRQQWTTTVRADLGLNKFDLYMAQRATADEEWSAAKSLGQINRPQANEGAPYLGPNGVFLYFVSDRVTRPGEDTNFDIFRARIRGESVYDVENLGSGVNTAANEIEPALSPEGFRLFFSRNLEEEQPAVAEQPLPSLRYALFCSEAIEVEEITGWGESYLAKISEFVVRNWWWLMAILLTLLFLLALLWYLREVSLRRAPLPGFFLAALLIHLLLGFTSFYVYFGQEIYQQIQKEFEEVVIATHMSSENLHQSHEPGQEAYEKVADLTSLETVQPTDVARQQTEMPNMPVPTDTPVPQVPTRFEREMPPDRLIAPPPKLERETAEQLEFARRNAVEPTLEEQLVEIEQARAVEQLRRERLERTDVSMVRQASATPAAATPSPIRRRVADPAVQFEREAVPVEYTVEGPAPSQTTQEPTIERTVRTDAQPEPGAQVEPEQITAPAAGPRREFQPEGTMVALAPRQPGTGALSGITAPIGRTATDVEVQFEREAVAPLRPAFQSTATAPIGRRQPSMEMHRVMRPVAEPIARAQVQPEAVAAVPSGSGGQAEGPVTGQAVEIGPRQPTTQIASLPTTRLGPLVNAVVRLEREQIEARRATGGPPSAVTPASVEMPVGERRRVTPTLPSEGPQLLEPVAAAAAAAVTPSARGGQVRGIDVGISRPDAQWARARVKTAGQFGGTYNPRKETLVVGALEKEAVDAAPSFSPLASRLPRRPARAPLLKYAEDNIGLQAMFRMRRGDSKADVTTAFGGSDETLAAVRRGLSWLDKHQHDDGYWSLEKFYQEGGIPGQGDVENDVGATGFALLPFLGDGHTHQEGQYQSTVRDAVAWLVERQTDEGELEPPKTGGNTQMYSHAIATIALCEAYGMSKDPNLREPAQRAIDFIIKAQHEPSGGWRYTPNQDADTSVVGWQMMALKSGQMAALNVPGRSLELLDKWLRSVEGRGGEIGRFSYQRNGSKTPAMTAEALLCLQYLGTDRNDPRLQAGVRYLLENLPKKDSESSYYWYYGTQVMFHYQGEPWKQWNDALRDMLVETQQKSGKLAGTWDPKDQWEQKGGRIYGTSLKLLMLEVYYRHLPLYSLGQ